MPHPRHTPVASQRSFLPSALAILVAVMALLLTPHTPQAASATITAKGRVAFKDDKGQVVPVKRAKITLYDYDCVLPGTPIELCRAAMASGSTNDDGTFQLSGSGTDADLCVGQVVGDQCCDGLYQSNCTLGTRYGDNQCCVGAYEANACDIGHVYVSGKGCCNGVYNGFTGACYGSYYPSYSRCDGVSFPEAMQCTGAWVGRDHPDPFIQVEAESAAGAGKVDPGAFTYCLRTTRRENMTNGTTIDFGDIMPDNALPCCDPCITQIDVSTEDFAWWIHNNLYEAYKFSDDHYAGSIDACQTTYPSQLSEWGEASFHTPHSFPFGPFGGIKVHRNVRDTGVWRESTMFHEYGHHIMADMAESPNPYYYNGICDPAQPFSGHCAWRPEDGCFNGSRGSCNNNSHFTEGWANFFSQAATTFWGKDSAYDWEPHCDSTMRLHAVLGMGIGQTVYAAGDYGSISYYYGFSSNKWFKSSDLVTSSAVFGLWDDAASHNKYAVGSGGLIYIDDYSATRKAWKVMSSPTTQTLRAVWGTSNINIYAVGHGGTILHYDGVAWTAVASGVVSDLHSLWGSAINDIYAVGKGGSILHFDGSSWSVMTSGSADDLYGVWGSTATDIYAVGKNGAILHFDGLHWAKVTSGTSNDLFGVWALDANNIFAVGAGGTILRRLNGGSWTALTSGTAKTLRAVWGNAATAVYAVGDDSTTLRFDGSSWKAMPAYVDNRDALCPTSGEGAPQPGDNPYFVEGFTAAILWDIYDDTPGENHDGNSSNDRLHLTYDEILRTLLDYDPAPGDSSHNHPTDLNEFFNGFRQIYPQYANRLAEIFDENHIVKPSANLSVSGSSTPVDICGGNGCKSHGRKFLLSDATQNSTANADGLATGESSSTQFFISTDNLISRGDVPLGQRQVPGLLWQTSNSGVTEVVIPGTVPPGNYTLGACADGPGQIFEGGSGEDDNCKAFTGTVSVHEPDQDLDGFASDVDCNDADATIYPGQAETCNGKDENCDGRSDEGVANACGGCGILTEVCDGRDNDCDGQVDEGMPNTCGIIFVKHDASGLPENGSSWTNAFNTLQEALAAAQAWQQIWVAAGTYRPNEGLVSPPADPRSATFTLKAGIKIFGGFAGFETNREDRDWRVNRTILSGDAKGDDAANFANNGENSYHVLTADAGTDYTCVLDGFIVTAGNAGSVNGGGLLAYGSPTITHCTFIGNSANSGGAVATDASFSKNVPFFTNCLLLGNRATYSGGAIYAISGAKYDSSPSFFNCLLSGNTATTYGGAIHGSTKSTPVLANCTLSGNSTQAKGTGGAIYADGTSRIKTNNCIIWGNTAPTGPQIALNSGEFNASVLCLQGGKTGISLQGTGVVNDNGVPFITTDPLFADANGPDNIFGTEDDNPRLATNSKCREAGNDLLLPMDSTDLDGDNNFSEKIPLDLDARPRVQGKLDLGAFEFGALVYYVFYKAGGSEDGLSWNNAFVDLQDALAAARSGDQIWVAQGSYTPDRGGGRKPLDQGATFQLKNGVALYGGFPGGGGMGDRNPRGLETILSGDLLKNDGSNYTSYGDNSLHVVTGSGVNSSAILDGFVVSAGSGSTGAGMLNEIGSPVVTNCTFRKNRAGDSGGGMYNRQASPAITNCTFTSNLAYKAGGGICNNESSPTITSSIFSNNSSQFGGGGMFNSSSSPTLSQCSFTANRAERWGGAMYNTLATSKPVLTNCTFNSNQAAYGGAVYNLWQAAPVISGSTFSANSAFLYNGGAMHSENGCLPTVTSSRFVNNTAVVDGGAIFNYAGDGIYAASGATVSNTLFQGNRATGKAGAFASGQNDTSTLTNCTFYNNSGSYGGALFVWNNSRPEARNSIFWNNSAASGGSQIGVQTATLTITYSDVEGGLNAIYRPGAEAITYANNLENNPLFADTALHLDPLSPAVDGGCIYNPAAPDPKCAFTNEPLPNGSRINLGHYGNTAEATMTLDSDNDTVAEGRDICPDTPSGLAVDASGCANVQIDNDNDGYTELGGDCNDSSKEINPAAQEVCGDTLDNNCDGKTDDTGTGAQTFYLDSDGDRFGASGSPLTVCNQPSGYATKSKDCDDKNLKIYPGAVEYCDGLDNDCDGAVDESFPTLASRCTAGTGDCLASGIFICNKGGTAAVCNAIAKTGSPEVCDDRDNDCDGTVDDGYAGLGAPCSAGLGVCEQDGSMVCGASGQEVVCNAEPGTSSSEEICDGVDNDCNGLVDEPCAYALDSDGDLDFDGLDLAALARALTTGQADRNDIEAFAVSFGLSASAFTNTHGMNFVRLQPGSFLMGSPLSEPGRLNDETRHEVTLTRPFYMQTLEVTQGQWQTVMGATPSAYQNCPALDCPVESVSWLEVASFIEVLNATGKGLYRLPTEAEWEYAARAGTTTALPGGDISSNFSLLDPNLDAFGWYQLNSFAHPHPVGKKNPNGWGLYDMNGNVFEFVQDRYGAYPAGTAMDPAGPDTGTIRVVRGGAWNLPGYTARAAARGAVSDTATNSYIGFRLVFEPQ